MPKAFSPTEELRQFREMLVNRRREIVAFALRLPPPHNTIVLEERAAALRAVQDQIEAVDRALKDEDLLEPAVHEKRGLTGF